MQRYKIFCIYANIHVAKCSAHVAKQHLLHILQHLFIFGLTGTDLQSRVRILSVDTMEFAVPCTIRRAGNADSVVDGCGEDEVGHRH